MAITEQSSSTNFVVLYRWRLNPGAESAFIAAWSRVTDLLRARGSLGSRLHRGSDGLWYGYAQWPDALARQKAFAAGAVDEVASARMQAVIAESLPEVVLTIEADFIQRAEGSSVLMSDDVKGR